MNRKKLIEMLAARTDTSKVATDRYIAAFVEIVTATLASGDNVSLSGFGVFDVRKRSARNGRNPATGAVVKIKASMQPSFKAGAPLKAAVNGGK